MFKKLIGALLLAVTFATPVLAAEGGMEWDRAPSRINNMASLQHGAKLFVNYCLNCHSANSMRYNKLTELGLTEEQIKQNLLFTGDKVGELMHVAMSPAKPTVNQASFDNPLGGSVSRQTNSSKGPSARPIQAANAAPLL